MNNMDETVKKSSPNKTQWTAERLRKLNRSEIEALFKTLIAPKVTEMSGEYTGIYIGARGRFFANLSWHLTANSNLAFGKWLGKSFIPESETNGHGYNNLAKFGMKRSVWPMKTSIGQSIYDGKDIFLLRYGYFYSLAGIANMQDEIRKLDDNTYLGVGHWKLPPGIPMAPVWFLLKGPNGSVDLGYL